MGVTGFRDRTRGSSVGRSMVPAAVKGVLEEGCETRAEADPRTHSLGGLQAVGVSGVGAGSGLNKAGRLRNRERSTPHRCRHAARSNSAPSWGSRPVGLVLSCTHDTRALERGPTPREPVQRRVLGGRLRFGGPRHDGTTPASSCPARTRCVTHQPTHFSPTPNVIGPIGMALLTHAHRCAGVDPAKPEPSAPARRTGRPRFPTLNARNRCPGHPRHPVGWRCWSRC